MSYFRCGDPLDDFDRLDRLQSQREEMLPQCEKCGKHINDDIFFEIDGQYFCEECVHDLFSRSTEDWLRDHYA